MFSSQSHPSDAGLCTKILIETNSKSVPWATQISFKGFQLRKASVCGCWALLAGIEPPSGLRVFPGQIRVSATRTGIRAHYRQAKKFAGSKLFCPRTLSFTLQVEEIFLLVCRLFQRHAAFYRHAFIYRAPLENHNQEPAGTVQSLAQEMPSSVSGGLSSA